MRRLSRGAHFDRVDDLLLPALVDDLAEMGGSLPVGHTGPGAAVTGCERRVGAWAESVVRRQRCNW